MSGGRGVLAGLRGYQLAVVRAVGESVVAGEGRTFTVLFPRQAGKNELSAVLELCLLVRHRAAGGSLVKAAPTLKPQLLVSIRRLEGLLRRRLPRAAWRRREGGMIEVGSAQIAFVSAQPEANVMGATGSLLLECDEAQDVEPEKWDRELVPMGASGNATRVLYGTPWTDETLLARKVERAKELERRDGVKRHFEVGWEEVAKWVRAYRRHVEGEIERWGALHPIVRTQYLLEPLARADRLLSAEQLELLRGEHPALQTPAEPPRGWGRGAFVAGIDVAGADEEDPDGLMLRVNPRRDATVATVAYAEERTVEGSGVSIQGSGDGGQGAAEVGGVVEPRLYVVRQYAWRGVAHRALYPRILALVRERWRCKAVVVDATGVGGGLAAFLGAALGPRVVTAYQYTAASKSTLAFDYLGAVNAGRVRLYRAGQGGVGDGGQGGESGDLLREVLGQAGAARYELGSGQVMRWRVPEREGHDDLLNALVLCVQAGPLAPGRVAVGRMGGW